MNGLWLKDGSLTLRQDLPPPEPRSDELLIDVRAAGICGTDIEMLAGYAAFHGIPGHEFVGDVVEGPPDWLGQRVVSSINIGCGRCAFCTNGLVNHCLERQVIGIRDRHGAFAEQLAVPLANAHVVPQGVTDESAVLVEPLAAALEIPEQVPLAGTERVLIVGAGRLAQLIAQVLAVRLRDVEVLVRSPAREAAFAPLNVKVIAKPTPHYDLVVECSGRSAGLEIALSSVRPKGTVVIKSTLAADAAPLLNRVVVNELTVIGSRCGPFDKAIAWIRDGCLETAHLEFKRYGLDQFQLAFHQARTAGVYKVLLTPY